MNYYSHKWYEQQGKTYPMRTINILREELKESREKVLNEKGLINKKLVGTRHIALEIWNIKQNGGDIYKSGYYLNTGGIYTLMQQIAKTQEKDIKEVIKDFDIFKIIKVWC